MAIPWGEIRKALNTPGDWATVLIAGTVGFVGDVVSTVHGIPSPLTLAGLSASGALGVKKGYEASRAAIRRGKAAKKVLKKVKDAPTRAEKLKKLFEQKGFNSGVQKLQNGLDLHALGEYSDAELDEVCAAAANEYAAWDGENH